MAGNARENDVRPEDLPLLREPSRPRLSADGRRVAVAFGRIDLEADDYRGDIWVMPSDGSARPVRLTSGARDADPAWSPDGRWLSFLRSRPGVTGAAAKPQLYLMGADGGEPFALTEHPLGVSGAVWSPDGQRIAYLARVPEAGRYGTDPRIGPNQEPPRRIVQLSFKRDLVGYKIDQRRHVFVTAVPDGPGAEPPASRQLTQGDFDHVSLSWAPDGRELAVVSARHEDRDTRLVQDAFAINADTQEVRQITDSGMVLSRPTFSRDGQSIYFLGYRPGRSGRDVFGFSSALWVVPADGSSAPRRVSAPGVALPSDRSPDLPSGDVLVIDDDGVLVDRPHRGAVQLVRVSFDGEVREVISGPLQVVGFDAVNGLIAASVATDTSDGDVVVLRDGEQRVLTGVGEAVRRNVRLFPLQEVNGVAPDGYPVHGFIVRPEGPGPHPLITFINGGPFVQAGWHLFDEAQVLAGAGYAVLLTNERGRCGYGEEHGRAVMGQMAKVGAADILSLVDAAVKLPDVDAQRVGVMGGSYGGFMTSWLVTQTDRFAAAISERALNDWDRSGDIGYYYPDYYIGETPEEMRASSPIAHADSITTPMLLIHSEQDIDVPLVQAERLFFTLKLRGAAVEMLIFPGEGHDLTRSGLPSHRVSRFRAVTEWFDRWLKES